jgi:iron only hydrogenase large subunit-like protein
MTEFNFYHAHEIIDERCDGRLGCLRVCPTKALRIRDNKVIFYNDLCIDCGLCIDVCSENVFVPINDTMEDFKSFKFHVAIPSNILYTQFGTDIHPTVIHEALKNIGFDEIADVAKVCDEVGFALHHHMEAHPEVKPCISTFCPSIVRLVQVSYPNLVKHLVRLDVPREIVAREVKSYYSKRQRLKEEEIGIIYITPCPAKIVSIKQPAEKERSWIDGAIPIRDIYNLILPEIIKVQESPSIRLKKEFLYGKAWGILGHFSQIVGSERSLSVSGIDHVKQILSDIEGEKLHNIDFIEALSCIHGCVNGTFCVKDPYVARHNSIQIQKKLGETPPLNKEKVLQRYKDGYYFHESPLLPRVTRSSETNIADSIKRVRKRERIYAKLPKKNCSVCGAPDCETFADDCARNEAEVTDCFFFSK